MRCFRTCGAVVVAALVGYSTLCVAASSPGSPGTITAGDLFTMEEASQVRLSPDGHWLAYVRSVPNVMTDSVEQSLWLVDTRTRQQHRLARDGSGAAWSAQGDRLAFVAPDSARHAQIYTQAPDAPQAQKITDLATSPGALAWSGDGGTIGFIATVKIPAPALPPSVEKPAGAHWAEPLKIMDWGNYFADGSGFLDHGTQQVFVVGRRGGAVRQLTRGAYRLDGNLSWTADNRSIVFSASRTDEPEARPGPQHLYAVGVDGGNAVELTHARATDTGATVSPDGAHIAFIRMEDHGADFDWPRLMVIDRDGSHPRQLGFRLDRDMGTPRWSRDGRTLYARYEDNGMGHLARFTLNDAMTTLLDNLAGDESYSVANDGAIAFQAASMHGPADVWLKPADGAAQSLTRLNADTLVRKVSGKVSQLPVHSSVDGKTVGTWITLPPTYQAGTRYPMILFIHGGPHGADAGDWEVDPQLLAAAGYVVVDPNYRGSISYGSAFSTHDVARNFPGPAYDDLMSAVDAAVAAGYADPKRLFVEGGSAGGELTAWIVGKTSRFAAAVTVKPVIDEAADELSNDQYRATPVIYGVEPWENHEIFWQHSALFLVGHVSTPTMVMVGDQDWRTPITQSLEFYNALRLRGVPSQLVVVPGAGHESLRSRPSQHAAEIAAELAWFARYGGTPI